MPRADGLSSVEAAARREAFGPNALPPPRRPSAWRRLGRQLVHFFALMLWVAALLALLGGLPELAVAIAVVVVLNAVFAFAQEHRADRAAERLQQLLPQQVVVRRDGRSTRVDAVDVVVGDVLVLQSGDRVPADATVTVASALLADVSTLTGESEPVAVDVDAPLYAGTFVVEGEADAEVTAIGSATRLAGIAALTTSTRRHATPLARELQRVVRVIALIAVGLGGLFFGISLALGNAASEGFVFAVGVTVALVPEALLPTVTLSLAWGAEQMSKRQVLVRNLDAVETLGSTTFICTDKTGTLTKNQMTVVHAWTPMGTAVATTPGYDPAAPVTVDPTTAEPARGREAVTRLADAAAVCSVGFAHLDGGEWRAHGDPMEAALDVFARRLRSGDGSGDPPEQRSNGHVERRFPFDPQRRRMSVVAAGRVAVKGAPDSVLPLCREVHGADRALEQFTSAGLRVLAVAERSVGSTGPTDAADAERDLQLLGLIAMEDPPRQDVAESIGACRRAGVKVAVVTGDHPVTAAAIATEIGLRDADGTVLVGDDLPEDDDGLGPLLDEDGIVVARVSPEQKLRIARALRSRGHIVAMTGDGVNDGPALREADIGVAMGASGTDVAREAADLVLLDDHFASIVAGIEQGRATFLNIRRFLTYHLTDNVAELTPFVVWAVSAGRFPLALGVLQILALDIGTDTFSAVALGAERPAPTVLDRPPVTGRLLDRTVAVRAFGLLGPTIAVVSMGAFVASLLHLGWRGGDADPTVAAAASGAAFMAVVLGQAANAFACRSTTRWPGALGWTSNRLLLVAVPTGIAVSLLVLLVGPIARQLGHSSPPLIGWVVALGSAVAVLAVDAGAKAIVRRRSRVAPQRG